jgi:hypothetical protein
LGSALEVCTFWLGRELRYIDRMCLASMVKVGLDVALYAYEPVAGLPRGVTMRDAEKILPYSTMRRVNPDHPEIRDPRAKLQFSDLFRLALMRAGKGFWLDTDVYMLRHFLPDPSKFYLALEGRQRFGVSALYFPKDHPLLEEVFRWVEGNDALPSWLRFRRGVARPFFYRLAGKRMSTLDAGTTIFGNDGITLLARKYGLFAAAAPKSDFYYWTARDTEKIFDAGSAEELLSLPDIKGFHIHRKALCNEPPVAGSFFDWAVCNVEDRL